MRILTALPLIGAIACQAPASSPTPKAESPTPSAAGQVVPATSLEARIVSLDASAYEIDHDVVAQVLLDAAQHRFTWTRTETGYVLDRIAPGSILARLGLVSGDVVTALGDVRTHDVDAVRRAYADAKRARKLVVALRRNGAQTELTYRIRGVRSPRPIPPRSSREPPPKIEGLVQVSDDHYRLPRTSFETLLEDPSRIGRLARVVPHFANGEADGFRLFGMRRTSPISAVGLKNGDTIHEVNGHALGSPQSAIDVVSKIRGAKQITVRLTRRGRPMTLTYDVTD